MMKMIIPLAILLAIPNAVNADEPYAGYEQDRARAERQDYIKKVAGSICGRHVSVGECRRRIQREQARRERIYVAEPRHSRDRSYSETRDRDYDRRYAGSGRCWREVIRAKGLQRIKRQWAINTAIETWQKEVRYDAGEAYMSWRRADKIGGDEQPGVTCSESSVSQFGIQNYRCEVKARPCKGS